nr:reverse transcriptase domain-containing protein [Bacillus sp. AFS040349]
MHKYVTDGTVLNVIWKWLKAGYLEDGKYLNGDSGTPQGGVISPLLEQIYLNEHWTLAQNIHYADDFLLFTKTENDIKDAKALTQKILDLGLEISLEKQKSLILS